MNKFVWVLAATVVIQFVLSSTTLYWANHVVVEQAKELDTTKLRLERVCSSLTTKQKHDLAFGGCTFIISKE